MPVVVFPSPSELPIAITLSPSLISAESSNTAIVTLSIPTASRSDFSTERTARSLVS